MEEGATVRFQCAIAGHPTPWVTWDKDGLILTPTRRLTIKEKDDLRVVEISDVTLEDAGLYRVTLENDVGRVEASARLDVIGECQSKYKINLCFYFPQIMFFRNICFKLVVCVQNIDKRL